MKALIMAAGKSTRTHPLTLGRPKALLRVLEKPILQHNLEALFGLADEVVIVVGYMKESVMKAFGSSFMGMRITYVEQGEQLGTGHAVLQARHLMDNRFIVMNGDDIYSRESIRDCLKRRLCCLGSRVKDPERFGVWVTDESGRIRGFAEKPQGFVSDLANCGLYVLDESIFPELQGLGRSTRGEYELNEALNSLAGKTEAYCIESRGYWLPIGYPWDLLRAGQVMLGRMQESEVFGEVEPGVALKGNVHVGQGTLVRSGTVIEGPAYIGPNCIIGPHAYIRPDTVIEEGCRIRAEVVDSLIMRNTTAKHHSYIGHSVIGEDVNIAAGTITADFRHDGGEHVVPVKGAKVRTGRTKLGAFLGDGVCTGINTSIYPGRRIWPGMTTLPGQVVDKDISQ